ncbi:MAG: class I SAM-dependent methyltransferase [Deltaproteobacteria bacterium]|nr:class I SAM-dependent methyltransferase [Deltaproteobacteria bacterium]
MSISDFHRKDYTKINTTLHVEDSPWKIEKVRKLIGERLSPRVICDIGCGAGLIAKGMAEAYPDAKVIGLDISLDMLEAARRNNPEADFVNARIESLPIGEGKADIIMLMDVLEHLEDPGKVLRALSQVARHLVIKVPLEDSLWYWANDKTGRYTREDNRRKLGHIQYFKMSSLTGLLRGAGFEVVAYEIISQNVDNPDNPHISKLGKVINPVRVLTYKVSKTLFARVFNGSVMLLAANTRIKGR